MDGICAARFGVISGITGVVATVILVIGTLWAVCAWLAEGETVENEVLATWSTVDGSIVWFPAYKWTNWRPHRCALLTVMGRGR